MSCTPQARMVQARPLWTRECSGPPCSNTASIPKHCRPTTINCARKYLRWFCAIAAQALSGCSICWTTVAAACSTTSMMSFRRPNATNSCCVIKPLQALRLKNSMPPLRSSGFEFQHDSVVVAEPEHAGLVRRGQNLDADLFQPCGDGCSIERLNLDTEVFDPRRLSRGGRLEPNACVVLEVQPEPFRIVLARPVHVFPVYEMVVRQGCVDVPHIQHHMVQTERRNQTVRLDRQLRGYSSSDEAGRRLKEL